MAEFPIAISVFLFLTLAALITGLIFMAIGGKKNQTYSTKLMVLRILLQSAVVVCLVILYFLH
jgi:hypothetical protein